MKKRYIFLIFQFLFALALQVSGQTSTQPAQYKLTLDPDGTYKVWMKSLNTYTGTNARIGTAQVSLVVPTGSGANQFTVTNLTGNNSMTWTTSTQTRLNNPSVSGTPTGKDYIVFGFTQPGNVLFDINANQEILLFSFKNSNTCTGPVALWETTDPLQVPNADNFNVGNQITIFGAGFGNKWHSNYGTSPVPCNAPPTPDLQVSITPPTTITQNSPATFGINVTNVGTGASTGTTTVTTPIPAGMTYTSASGTGWTCNQVATDVVCTNPNSIPASGSSPYSLTFTPTQSGASGITSTVSGGGDPTPSTTNPVSLTINPAPTGCLIEYKITTEADGSYKVWMKPNTTFTGTSATIGTAQVTVVFPMPSGGATPVISNLTGFNSMTWTTGTTQQLQQGNYYYVVFNFNQSTSPTVFNLTAGTEIPLFTFKNTALCNGPASLWATTDAFQVPNAVNFNVGNQISVSGAGIGNKWCGNYGSTAPCPITTSPNVVVTTTAPTTATVGTPITVNVNVSNTGTGGTTAPLVVTTPIPACMTYTSSTGTGWTCTQQSTNVVCNYAGTVAAGSSAPLALNFTPTQTCTTTITTTTTGGGLTTPVVSPSSPITVNPAGSPTLAVSLTAPATGTQNVPFSYTATVSNTGTSATTGTTTVTLPLPSGVTYVSGTGTGWTCVPQGTSAVCSTPNPIPSGSSSSLTISVNPTTTGTVSTFAYTSGGGANTAFSSLVSTVISPVVVTQPNVVVSANSNPATATVGTPFTQNLTISNIGNGAATGPLTYTTTLPTGVNFSSVNTGWTCSQVGQQLTCTNPISLSAGASTPLNIQYTATSPVNYTPSGTLSGNGVTSGSVVGTPISVTSNSSQPCTATDCGIGVRYGIKLGSDGKTYTVYMKSATTYTGGSARIGTAQVTLKVPHGTSTNRFIPINIVGHTTTGSMVWTTNNSSRVDAPSIDINNDYIFFGFNQASSPALFDIQANVEYPLFSFQNQNNCSGTVALWETTDPFQAGFQSLNPGNQMTILGNGTTNAWKCNYSCALPCQPPADLTISASQPLPTLSVGQTSTINVTVTNLSTNTATGQLTVTTTLPAGVSTPTANFTAGAWSCTTVGQTVTCTTPNTAGLAQNGTSSFALPVVPSSTTAGQFLTFNFGVTGGSETNLNNNSTSLITTNAVTAPDLAVSIPSFILNAGQASNLTVNVSNIGNATANGVLTTNITLPSGASAPASFTSNGWSCTTSGQNVVCTNPNSGGFAPGASSSIIVPVSIPANALGGQTVTIVANVAPNVGESNTSNNSTSGTGQVVAGPTLKLIKSASAIATQGTPFDFTFTVFNTGSTNSSGTITVTDTLRNGLKFVSATGTGWTCSKTGVDAQNNDIVQCVSSNSILANAANNSTFTIKVNPTQALTANNTAYMSGGGSTAATPIASAPCSNCNSGATGVFVQPAPDLTVIIQQPNPTLIVGQPSNINIIINNTGGVITTAPLTVNITLPVGITMPATFTSGGWVCTSSGQNVSCTNPNTSGIPAGGSINFNLSITPPMSLVGTTPTIIVNVLPIAGESNTTNNGGTLIIINPIAQPIVPDLAISIGQPTSNLVVGQQTYLPVTITNIGSGVASGQLTVSMTVPTGFTIPSTFANNGWTFTLSGNILTGTYPNTAGLSTSGVLSFQIPITPNAGAVNTMPIFFISVNPVNSEINFVNNTSFMIPTVGVTNPSVPNLVLTISQSTNFVANQVTNMVVNIINAGTANATGNLTMSFTMPSGISAPAIFSSNGWACTTSGQTVNCTNLNGSGLAPNAQTSIVVPVTPSTSLVGLIPSVFLASVNQVVNEVVVIDNTAFYSPNSVVTNATAPNIVVTINQPIPALVVGQTSTITVNVLNNGTAPTTGNTTINVVLPSTLSVPSSFTSNGWMCNTSANTNGTSNVSCIYAGSILPNTSTNINISVTPVANTSGQNPGSITIIINGTPVPQPIILIGTITPAISPDLKITMLQPISPLQAGQVGYIPVTVTNVGASTVATPISVTVTLPSGFSSQSSFVQGSWSCTSVGQTVTCSNPNVYGLTTTGQVGFWLPVTPSTSTINTMPTFSASVNVVLNEVLTVNNQTNMTLIIPVQGTIVLPTLIPDLSISVSQPQPNFVVGQNSIMNVVVTNVGQGLASGQLTVNMAIPAGITVATGTSNGWTIIVTGSTLTATHPNTTGLVSGGSLTFALTAMPNSTIVNTLPTFVAVVNMASNEINALNNTAILTTNVGVVSSGIPNLSISAILNNAFVVNQTSFFNVTVLNSGTVPANGPLTVTITLPSGMTSPANFTSNGWSGTTSGQTITLTNPNGLGLASGGSLIIQVPVTPLVANTVPATFVFNVSQAAGEVVFIDNTFYYIPTAPVLSSSGANITVNVISVLPSLTVGQPSNITINFINTGTQTQTGQQTINIVIPNGLSVPSSFTTSTGWTCTLVGQTLMCTNPNTSGIQPNGNINLIIPITPNTGTAGTTPSPINIFVNGSTSPIIYVFTSPIVAAPAPNLTVNVMAMPVQMIAGQSYFLPIAISNIGSSAAIGQLTVNVTLPNGMSAPSLFTQAGWTCTTSGQTMTCTNPNTLGMPIGSTNVLLIPITPSSILVGTTPSITINVLPISGEIITTNNTIIYIINPPIISIGAPDIAVQVSQPSPVLMANQTSAITITVQNVGTSAANGQLSVSFILPANFSAPSNTFTSGAWTCNVVGQNVTCTNPNTSGFAVGASSLLSIQLTPNNAAVGSTFMMTIGASSTIGEVNLTNNTAILLVNVPVAPDPNTLPNLNVVVTYNQSATYYQNTPFNFTFLVYNGSSSVTSTGTITVRDTLRYGMKFISGTGSGWSINKVGVDAQGNDIIVATLSSILPSNASSLFSITVNPTLAGTLYTQAFISGGGMALSYKASAPCINCTLMPTGPIVINQTVSFNVAVKALLQGPYVPSTGLMHDSLRVKNRIPLNNPYTSLSGFIQVGSGSETTTSSVLSVVGNNAIVDWVLIELRNASNPSQIVATKAGLIQRDGDVVSSVDGISPLSFSSLNAGSYYVSIRHRNHLGAMSATPLTMTSGSTTTLDLTNATQPAYKLTGSTTSNYPQYVSGTKAMLWAGNAVANNQVIFQGPNNDVDMIFFTIISDPLNTSVISNFIHHGYDNSDINMDGKTVFQGPDNEVDIIFFNVLMHPENPGFLANFIVWQQLP